MPPEIVKIKNLRTLYLQSNMIEALSNDIGKLKCLEELYLHNNILTSLPPEIGNLKSLKSLKLCNNRIQTFPVTFKNLLSLEKLYMEHNELELFPLKPVCFPKLKILYLQYNKLKSLPSEITELHSLRILDLANNDILELPSNMGNFQSLQELYLENNKLTFLPSSLIQLQNYLTTLDIRRNNIVFRSDDLDKLGLFEIISLFRYRLKIGGINVKMTKTDIYEKLAKNKIYWNIEKLRSLRAYNLITNENTENELMIKFTKIVDNNREFINMASQGRITRFIKHLYNVSEEYEEWRIPNHHIQLAKNYLNEIINILSNNAEDNLLIVPYISRLAKGLKHCPDRKIAELREIYNLLTNNMQDIIDEHDVTIKLNKYVETFIARKKEMMFNNIFTRFELLQNVHILNYWKYTLRNELGIDFNVNFNLIDYDELWEVDKFKLSEANALLEFYSYFTPEYIIDELTNSINDNNLILNCALQILYDDDNFDDKLQMIKYEEDNISITDDMTENELINWKCMYAKAITKEFIKDYLVKHNIININQNKKR